MKWEIVRESPAKDKAIGAIGILDGKVAVVVPFFEDADYDEDGEVDFVEKYLNPANKEGYATTRVLSNAAADMDLLTRFPELRELSQEQFADLAKQLGLEAAYKSHIERGISAAGKVVGVTLRTGVAKRILITKGMEATVKKFLESLT